MLPSWDKHHSGTAKGRILAIAALFIFILAIFKAGQYWGSTTSPLKFNRGGRSDSLPTKEKGTTEQHDEPQLTRISTTKPIGEFEPWIETVSWKPRVFLYHNFLTQAECDEVLQLAGGDVERSQVVGEGGKSVTSEYRTSNGVFLGEKYMMESRTLRDIERRIADFTHLPRENGEHFYLIRYQVGQEYKAHQDYFHGGLEGESGNRIATVLMYVGTPEAGGDTTFPDAGLRVHARKGDAVLFWDFFPDYTPDPKTLHAAEPVKAGTKWSMTKWIRPRKTYRWDENLSAEQKAFLADEDKDWMEKHSSHNE